MVKERLWCLKKVNMWDSNIVRKNKSHYLWFSAWRRWKEKYKQIILHKYQKYIACSHVYKLVCVDEKFGKSFKSYLGEDGVHKFINSMVEESKLLTWWKNIFTKNL